MRTNSSWNRIEARSCFKLNVIHFIYTDLGIVSKILSTMADEQKATVIYSRIWFFFKYIYAKYESLYALFISYKLYAYGNLSLTKSWRNMMREKSALDERKWSHNNTVP